MGELPRKRVRGLDASLSVTPMARHLPHMGRLKSFFEGFGEGGLGQTLLQKGCSRRSPYYKYKGELKT